MRVLRGILLSCLFLAAATAASAVDGPEIPDRMRQAKVGEWVLFQGTNGDNMGVQNKVSVTAVTDSGISLKRERLAEDGSVESTNTHDMNWSDLDSRKASLREKATVIESQTLFVKETEYPVVAVSWTDEGEAEGESRQFTIWISPDLPIGGLAKTWSSDHAFPSSEIVDFGF